MNIIKRLLVYSVLFLISTYIYYYLFNSFEKKVNFNVIVMESSKSVYKFYYTTKEDEEFSEEKSINVEVKPINGIGQNVKVNLAENKIYKLRWDIEDSENSICKIRGISVGNIFMKYKLTSNSLIENATYNNILVSLENANVLLVETLGEDPFISLNDVNFNGNTNWDIILALIAGILQTYIVFRLIHLKEIYNLFIDVVSNRDLILNLSWSDFKTKYSGSYFGVIWAFVQPVMTILIFWFVFQVGFRTAPIEGVPFILWLMCGLIPWFFFSEAVSASMSAFRDYSYLVKKVVFKITILPLVKIVSSLFVHLFFVISLILVFWAHGYVPNLYYLQLIYYTICMIALLMGISLVTSSVVVFFKDLSQIIAIILQLAMWLTPIVWAIDMVPDKYEWIFKLNPMYYIVNGYRDTMINNFVFYNNVKQTIYFWFVSVMLMIIGVFVYKKLKPHFADVL